MLKQESRTSILRQVDLRNRVLSASSPSTHAHAYSQKKLIAPRTATLIHNNRFALTTEGITDNDWDVIQPFHICPIQKIDTLITELRPEDPLLDPYICL